MDNSSRTLSPYDCASHRIPDKLRKLHGMRPSTTAGSTIGTKRTNNRKGGKIRGMKSGKQRQAKVNVANLVAKTKKR